MSSDPDNAGPVAKTKVKKTRNMPNKVHEEDLDYDRIENMAGIGLNLSQIAAILGISDRTFNRYMNEYPRLRDAVLKGRAKGIAQIANVAFKAAASGKSNDMTRFYLRTQAGWTEKVDIEHSGKTEVVFSTRIGTDGIIRKVDSDEMILDMEELDKLT